MPRLAVLVLLLGAAVARAAPAEAPPFSLRPLVLAEGIRDVLNPGGDPKTLKGRDLFMRALAAGLDLAKPQPDPVVGLARTPDRLFYVFYKTVDEAFADRCYLIQRIRRTERTWAAPDAEPEVEVTYQTEVFKLLGGSQKRADQHHGSYGMRSLHRREIVKEYEIGFGQVPGVCEGPAWPFAPGILFEFLEPYGPGHEIYDAVEFDRSVRWSLTVSLDAEGGYAVRAPELGIDLPRVRTPLERTLPEPDVGSEGLVFVRGHGLEGTDGGEDLVHAISLQAGRILENVPAGKQNRNVAFERRLIANLKVDGRLNTLRTRAGFAGRTKEGARVGDDRARILQLYGAPVRQYADAAWWHYGDIGFWFDGRGLVGRIYVRGARR